MPLEGATVSTQELPPANRHRPPGPSALWHPTAGLGGSSGEQARRPPWVPWLTAPSPTSPALLQEAHILLCFLLSPGRRKPRPGPWNFTVMGDEVPGLRGGGGGKWQEAERKGGSPVRIPKAAPSGPLNCQCSQTPRPLSPEREQPGRKTKAISDPGWGEAAGWGQGAQRGPA